MTELFAGSSPPTVTVRAPDWTRHRFPAISPVSSCKDQDGGAAAVPGDFLAGLGACIGAVQSVYLHGLLATVNEGSSPGR